MRVLTTEGAARVERIAQNYGVSADAARTMLEALLNGGGTMAQFSHPEFGGSGQWMQGGMTMVSDLFNNALKALVQGICHDLSALVLDGGPEVWRTESPAAGGGWSGPGWSGSGGWWPVELGSPNSSGGQNELRYAYFAGPRRLVIDRGGRAEVYDTGDHAISGVSQQQGNGWTLSFTSQFGVVPLDSLRRVGDHPPPMPQPVREPPVREPPVQAATVQEPPLQEPAAQPPAGPALTADALAGTTWILDRNGGMAGTLTLATDGTIGGDPQARYWSREGTALVFYDDDGRSVVRFDTVSEVAITGHGASGTWTLRPVARPTTEVTPPTVAPSALPVDLTAGGWVLEDGAGRAMATLRLRADGGVDGGGVTEAGWRIRDDALALLHGNGRPTMRFETFQWRAGRWAVFGALASDANAMRVLRQV